MQATRKYVNEAAESIGVGAGLSALVDQLPAGIDGAIVNHGFRAALDVGLAGAGLGIMFGCI